MNGEGDEIIFKHYQNVAKQYGLAPTSSMKDQVIRDGEINFFVRAISEVLKNKDGAGQSLFDVGCGNGHLLQTLREHFPKLKLYGLEFHPDLCQLAKSRNISECEVVQGDMRRELSMFGTHDIVVTERSVINLLSKAEQNIAFTNIAAVINNGGHYIFSESFEEPKRNINRARKEMALPDDVAPSKHNLWLSEEDLELLPTLGLKEIDTSIPKNYLSTHFYITRVFHPCVLPGGGRAGAGEFQNFFNQALAPAIGNYSPILFRVFAKSK